ncbi:MAG TPA: hypothetical protein VNG12_03475 [Acidimicrobiales bacterium]|nr:hypothetical protein [Acidimicrobiales bacterium]
MFRKITVVVAGLAVATGGLVAATAGVSGASPKPTVIAGPGSNISCNVTAKVKVTPSLKNNWIQSQHATDPDAAVRNIVDTTFAANGPVIVSAKGSGTCTGTVTDGVNTLTVTGVKFSLTNDPAHLGSSTPATCTSLVTGIPPSTAEYNTNISYTAVGGKVAPTIGTDQVIPPASFSIAGGTLSGSFAGGTAATTGVPDSTTVGAVLQAPASSTAPVPAFPQCEASIKIKPATAKHGETATLKAPKGLKKVAIVSGSTLAISR